MFTAGPAALKYVQNLQKEMNAIRDETRSTEDVVDKVRKNTQELIALRDEVKLLGREKAESLFSNGRNVMNGNLGFIYIESPESYVKDIIPIAMKASRNTVIRSSESITIAGMSPGETSELYKMIYGMIPEKPGKVIRDKNMEFKLKY